MLQKLPLIASAGLIAAVILMPAPGAAAAEPAGRGDVVSFGSELTECLPTAPAVVTSTGTFCGTERTNTQGQTARTYLGIPFAQPPVGRLRWKPPQPTTEPMSGLQRATRFGNECIQASPALVGFEGSEDCLYLNIYAPANATGPLPVMFYIHGGGFFLTQSHRELDGTALANEGVIVVTANYRLGSLGFMRSPDQGIVGNQGIQDQVAALEWVQQNIAAFGGDPSRVTAFGESAGAMSVGTLLFTQPRANDLFQAAIMESNIAALKNSPRELADEVGKDFVDLLCASWAPRNCPRTFDWLASLPVSAVAQAQALTLPSGGLPAALVAALPQDGYGVWTPGIGFGGVLDAQPVDGFAKGVKPRPFVYGMNATEGAFFLPAPESLTGDDYRSWLRSVVGATDAKAILSFTEKGRHLYSPAGYGPLPQGGMTAAAQALARFDTDFGIAIPNMIMASNALKSGVSAFGFHFVKRSSFDFTGLLRCSAASGKVCHTDEIPYVWSQFVEKDEFGFTVPAASVTADERQLGARMTAMWAAFAKNPQSGFGVPEIGNPYGSGYVKFGGSRAFGPVLPKPRIDLLLPVYRASQG